MAEETAPTRYARFFDAHDDYCRAIRALRESKRRWWQRQLPHVSPAECLLAIGPAPKLADFMEDT